ncbi:MAG TPA: Pls/PosA family non-ribosomal peptide synthetase [Candidatus Dormibacteraeota bacterium]|nr:Pls/PosA family non-ribosomal peptide synthetase [Candidatus Dormibacteraeota bacterium]
MQTTRFACPSQLFEETCRTRPHRIALQCGSEQLTYEELDRRANRLAHLLLRRRGAGELRVGILLERSVDTYVALLATLKAGGAFVPLDPTLPADRVAFIAADAGLGEVVTSSSFRERTEGLPCSVLELDRAGHAISTQPPHRPLAQAGPESLCYIIYTSGTTGRPKGVAVSRASLVNFLGVVAPIYAVTAGDRVYQGMTLAFDFSFEEIWPAWIAGATLVAGPTDSRRLGHGLTEFLIENRITVLCCVPTLLATIDEDVPTLRTLLVGGEACPAGMVDRWSRPGRRMLNTYGPTEATVTASWCELVPGRPVTIGRPLPTYRIHILDERLQPVAPGETGEICIGGPGVALGYVHRPDLTRDRFVATPIAADRATAPRLYRTGDLGRFTPGGEIEYLGRIDTQVKIRGYRIELGEIEAVIREEAAIENAVVTTLEQHGSAEDLVAYVTLRGDDEGLRERVHDRLRERLPAYMIPAHIEVLDRFPLLAADKVDRGALPAPTSPRLGARTTTHVAAQTGLERRIATVVAEVMGRDRVSVEDDFFAELGGHSLLAACTVSRLRRQPGLQTLAIADLYDHPTVRGLARFVAERRLTTAAEAPAGPPPMLHSDRRVRTCGLVQAGAIYGWMQLLTLPLLGVLYAVLTLLHHRVDGLAGGELDRLSPDALVAIAAVGVLWLAATMLLLPVAGSRLLMRGVTPGSYPLWGATYLRWWLQARFLALSPVGLLAGSPLLAPYLRLLGARIGRDCHLATGVVIGVPGLVEIGDGASLGYEVRVLPHAVEDGWLHLAPVRIGAGCFLGTNTVVQAGAVIGEGTAVGEQSLVPAGQVLGAGENWVGSPLQRRSAPALLDEMERAADGRPWTRGLLAGYVAGAVAMMLLPLLMLAPSAVLVGVVAGNGGLGWGLASTTVAAPLFVLWSCAVVAGAKRLVMRRAPAGIHHERSALGLRKWLSDHVIAQTILIRTIYDTLYLAPLLRLLGARVGRWAEVSTINFVDPDMLTLGDESFVAGETVVAPAVFHRGCVALGPARVGRRSFVGNGAILPGFCSMGEGSLLGLHSVPTTAEVEADTTLLGSPAVRLPRRQQSQAFPEELTFRPRTRLVACRLAIEFLRLVLPPAIAGMSVLLELEATVRLAGAVPPGVLIALMPLIGIGGAMSCYLSVVALKWLVIGRYRERVEPMWNVWVRRTELVTGCYSMLAAPALAGLLSGTPMLAPLLRLLGARIGRRVFLATIAFSEFDLVELGDDSSMGEEAALQTHLYEDRVMKMSRVRVGERSSLGAVSVVLYDAEVGAGARVDAQTLVMKGEYLPCGTRWRGIPARAVAAPAPAAAIVEVEVVEVEMALTATSSRSTTSAA